jgi:hypothetical protein
MIAQGWQSHYPPLSERFAKAPPEPENPTPLEAMSHRLQTPAGQKLYALRKQTPVTSPPVSTRTRDTIVRTHQDRNLSPTGC